MDIRKVGVLGTGDVGRTLASGFLQLGAEVMLGSREAKNEKVLTWVAENGDRAHGGTFEQAAAFGDVIVVATLGIATVHALKMAGPANFSGKVVIDTTNPLDFSKGAPPSLSIGHTDSLGELVQRTLPDARVVKAFNTVGNPYMIHPQFPGGPPDMFICGNDRDARHAVGTICTSFGWGVVDIGGIEGARHLEPLCMIWVLHGFSTGTWSHAFKLLHIPALESRGGQ